ncbi:MAG TPA: tyrosine-type recombinase/integrase [Anaerolineales bacterium]|nr:tyrosine-type recombinase/integrase [Anaerolineales bacterium]HMV95478.1 tyrosine-type recombinase/integrase [Anaerolineales bacterium]HMX17638.1 tyrosine-type recombinase/integrase [Anaerolineales bacterium]HMX73114.1 tyrosine-type recombinase/integrase [Anaerolineales bacterium]HMZ42012.1 tyrosine-type recombinase/integrase [Anaerolineales bacterium]
MAKTPDSAHISAKTLLPAAIQGWEMFMLDQGRSTNTVKAFLSDVRLLTQFLPPDQSIGSITTEDLNRFFTWMEKDRGIPCSPKTLSRRITSVKSFFRWLHQHGSLVLDPAEKVLQRSAISPLPQVLTDDEYEAVLLAADRLRRASKPDARSYTLVYLLLTTGIKKSECLGIHINHIDLEAKNGPHVFIRYASPANRYKERKIQLAEDWLEAYKEYLAQYQPVDQVFAWSPRRLEYLLEDIGNEAGLTKHLSFDMCRWTCALRDYQSGMEADNIRQKLGVSKIQWRELFIKIRQLNGEIK